MQNEMLSRGRKELVYKCEDRVLLNLKQKDCPIAGEIWDLPLAVMKKIQPITYSYKSKRTLKG